MPDIRTRSPWRRFWERGGIWKAILAAAVYFVLYQLGSLLFGPLLPPDSNVEDPVFILVIYVLPITLGGVILTVFALSLGWLRELFGPQPIRGRAWMWIAVAAVLLFNVLRFAALDYGSTNAAYIGAWLLAGLAIGFAEEVLTRGFVVNLVRRAGHREIVVALVSAGIFAALHAGNLFSGQSLFATALQLAYTFMFGICMYLTLRVTGRLIWPILLHASTDASIFLLTIHPGEGPLTSFAGLGNLFVIAAGIVLVFFIRGRLHDGSGQPSDRTTTETRA